MDSRGELMKSDSHCQYWETAEWTGGRGWTLEEVGEYGRGGVSDGRGKDSPSRA